ncbi:hypothetical protein BBJ28_00013559 [Nothophytophthora sp. Chile5]|nr:hypothetical protein BBJ28_00013559 [Nothophytophthora sp. Chile5]
MHDAITQTQLPFQPSPVLVHLIQNGRRRRNSSASDTACKQQLKSADYLDRKFESEMRQHYEVENAQHCGVWKRFHVQATEARRQVAVQIERDYRQFCRQLGDPVELDHQHDEQLKQTKSLLDSENNQQNEGSAATSTAPSKAVAANQVEAELALHLAQDWVQQERFNIQEAFTNQTRKLQEDLDAYLSHLDADFMAKRETVLHASSQVTVRTGVKPHQHHEGAPQFQSSTKRSMLLQTAQPLSVKATDDGRETRLPRWTRAAPAAMRAHSHSRRYRSDVDETQQKLDEIQNRLQTLTDAAEAERKNGMQWIGRQCAHMFAQLDCRETEAKVLALLLKEELSENDELRHRVTRFA